MAAKKQTPAQPHPQIIIGEPVIERTVIELPSITRTFGSLAAGAVVTGSLGYFGMAAVEVVTLSVAMLTGSAFMTFMTWYLSAFMVLIGAIMAGSYIQASLLDGSLEVACGKARSYVASLFSARKEVAA